MPFDFTLPVTCRRLANPLLLIAVVALGGCTRDIPNTTVPDNADNREVIEFMETYRHALEDRDVALLLGMALIVASGVAATWLRDRTLPDTPAEDH